MNKHKKFSKCSTLITTENYKKDRSVCKFCYNTNTLNLMKKRFGLLEEKKSSNQDVSDLQGSSKKEDISNKQVRTRKQVSSRKQDRSSNQDVSNKKDRANSCIIGVDPDLLCDRLRESFEKPDRLESDNIMIKMIIDELLRVKAITTRGYNGIRRNCNLK